MTAGRTDAPAPPADFAACTIVSKNYLSAARVWNASFRREHPGSRTFVLLVDRIEGEFDPQGEDFELVPVEDLRIPDFDSFAFKYTILELNTAVKPFFLEHLLRERGIDRVMYFDPDIELHAPVDAARAALEDGTIALIPHVLVPIPDDGRRPHERDLLVAGVYNLGFLGLRRSDEAFHFLSWWQTRVYDGCFSAPALGLFTDQKWIDLVPGLFSGVRILRERGYNVAYWNLHERMDLERTAEGYRFKDAPLAFFHFSGLEMDRPERVSKHQNRFRLRDLNAAYRQLFSDYVRALRNAGWDRTQTFRYAFGSFDDGVTFPPVFRQIFHSQRNGPQRWPNPFSTHGEGTFREWLLEASGFESRIPRFIHEVYRGRPDLQAAFPDGERTGAVGLLRWAVEGGGAREIALDRFFTDVLRRRLEELEEEARRRRESEERDRAERAAADAVQSAHDGAPKSRWKRAAQGAVGAQTYRRLRRFVWDLRNPSGRTAPGGFSEPVPSVLEAGPSRPFGVNVFGYFDTESGVGEIARSMAKMLRRSEVPHALINVEQQWLRRRERTIQGFSNANPYSINLVMVNADQVPAVCARYGASSFEARTNVAYWFWELSRFPDAYVGAFAPFDEVWVASTFCRDAIAAAAPIPVEKVPPGFEFRIPGRRDRRSFGLEPGDFVFLYVFDGASSFHRKNPAAAVSAFRKAFPTPGRERLLLKTTNAPDSKMAALRRLAGDARVDFLTDYLDRDDLLDLLNAADCYVSLHRSEGFGLTLIESMAMGKPVIATNYSGNADFLTEENGFPVSYRLVPIRRDLGPYGRGNEWAEPAVDEAAARMRSLADDPAGAGRLARRAAEHIRREWGIEPAARALSRQIARLSESAARRRA